MRNLIYTLTLIFVTNLLVGTNTILAQDPVLSIENKMVNPGEQFCTSFTYFSFDDLEQTSFDLTWDNSILKFLEENSKASSQEYFIKNATKDKIVFDFSEDQLTNKVSNYIEQDICFEALKEGNANILLTNEKSVYKKGSRVPQVLSGGELIVSRLGQAGVSVFASSEEGSPGADVCVDISVEDFTNITELRFTLSWNINIIEFDRIDNMNLNGMDISDFNTGVGTLLQFDWDATNTSVGETVSDGTAIFSVCFKVIGPSGGSSPVAFTTIPTIFFASDINSNGNDIGLMPNNGTVNIPNVAPLEFADFNVEEENCFGPNNGAVDITVTGGLTPYTFSWSNATSMEDLSGVSAGMYSVTVMDSSNPPLSIDRSFTIVDNTTAPTADAGAEMQIDCNNTEVVLDGALSSSGLMVEYDWTTTDGNIVSGGDTKTPTVDQAGTYMISVVDGENGCSAAATVLVSENKVDPSVSAGDDRTLSCGPDGINLNGENVDELADVSITWTTSDGAIDNGANTLSPAVSAVGTYMIELVNNLNGCSATDEMIVSAAVNPEAIIAEPESLNCDRTEITLDGSASTSGMSISYAWSTSTGGFVSGQNSASPVVNLPGEYTLTVADSETECTAMQTVIVQGNTERPTADAGMDATITCTILELTLVGRTDIDVATLEWTDQNGTVISDAEEIVVTTGGVFTFSVTNEFGCTQTDEVEVLLDNEDPIADAGAGFQIGCEGSTLSLDGSGSSTGADFEYMWSTSNGMLVSGFNTLTPEVSSAGVYDLIVTNTSNGCTALSFVEITLNGNLPAADAGENASLCETAFVLAGNITSEVTGVWTTTSSATISNSISENSAVSNLQVGANSFTWTLSSPDCPDYSSSEVILFVEDVPSAFDDQETIFLDSSQVGFDVLINDNLNSSAGVSVDFLTADPNFIDLGNGVFSYTFPNDSLNLFEFSYSVCNDVCPDLCDTAFVSIVREAKPLEPVDLTRIPNGITPNGDGMNDAFVFDLLLAEPDKYPNPNLRVFNRWGDVVYESEPYKNDWSGTNKSGKELPGGTYYYVLRLNISQGDILTGDITILR